MYYKCNQLGSYILTDANANILMLHTLFIIQTKLLLANPYANIEGQRIVVIPQQCKQRRTL